MRACNRFWVYLPVVGKLPSDAAAAVAAGVKYSMQAAQNDETEAETNAGIAAAIQTEISANQ